MDSPTPIYATLSELSSLSYDTHIMSLLHSPTVIDIIVYGWIFKHTVKKNTTTGDYYSCPLKNKQRAAAPRLPFKISFMHETRADSTLSKHYSSPCIHIYIPFALIIMPHRSFMETKLPSLPTIFAFTHTIMLNSCSLTLKLPLSINKYTILLSPSLSFVLSYSHYKNPHEHTSLNPHDILHSHATVTLKWLPIHFNKSLVSLSISP